MVEQVCVQIERRRKCLGKSRALPALLRVVSCRVVRTHPPPIEVATSVKQGVTLPPRPRKSGKKRRRTDEALGITRAKLSMDTGVKEGG